MDSATSLMSSFRRIPPAAIPATLDCILASTTSPPSSLFFLLLDALPILSQEVTHGSEEILDDEHQNFIASYVGALCHLLKKPGFNAEALQNFIWSVLIPLMRLTQGYDCEIVDKAIASFLDVVMETNAWGVVEGTMVPYFIKVVGLTMGMLQNEQFAFYKWNGQAQSPEGSTLISFESFPLLMACHILASILDASVKGNLLWDICNVTLQMLSHSPEHRSCAITVFLPHLLKALVSENVFEISVHGQKFLLSRKMFFAKIWKCCKNLFSMGPSERGDAYTVLSLYISNSSKSDGCEDDSVNGDGTFDLRAEKEFWDEMKKGLVDKESIVRKQSLHVLKSTVTISQGKQHTSVLESISNDTTSNSHGLTKRERWADKEAKSLGIESLCNSVGSDSSSRLKWGAFFLLYEMLEEYGTHLVEAAWNYQMNLLLRIAHPSDNSIKPVGERHYLDPMETLEDMFDWLAVLWQRGLCHDNPQVRCLIMQSVFGIEWKNHGNYAKFVPRDFVLGPFIQGLNDPVHHKEFGLKGAYSSRTIDGASTFLQQYTVCLSEREQMTLLSNLASLVKIYSFGRAGLMSFAECVAAAAAAGVRTHSKNEVEQCDEASSEMKSAVDSTYNDKATLLDVFRFIIESSKQHFNPNYRLKVCGKILDASASVMSSSDVLLEPLLHFISSFPPDFLNYGGPLREKVQEWLRGYEKQASTSCIIDTKLMKKLNEFPRSFIYHNHSGNDIVNYDDEDLEMWELKAKRWARALFLIVKEEHHLDSLLQFIRTHGNELCKKIGYWEWLPVKYMILILGIAQELHEMKNRTVDSHAKRRTKGLLEVVDHAESMGGSVIIKKFTRSFTFILEELVSYTNQSCSVFWSEEAGDTTLPSSIKGRLGGLSQRRLSSSNTTAVLQAITSVKTLASISSYCSQFQEEEYLSSTSTLDVLWQLSWKIISCTPCTSETKAEIYLGAYEALHHVLKSLVSMPSPSALALLTRPYNLSAPEAEVKPHMDYFVQIYIENINNLIEAGYLARARRAILIDWKWMCLESLLLIPKYALQRGVYIQNCDVFFSDAVIRRIFSDLVDSLENAGEGSVLPMLRSVRLVLDFFALGHKGSAVSSCDGIDVQMMWHLVRCSWLLHVSCNKRRVAPIAALLSSVLHDSVFSDMDMHESDDTPGPLKWFVEKILEEGTRSPRTIRLAALHLSGLWLSHPSAIKYYMKELKLLTLYGSVAFDEDFEAEVTENHDARTEVSILSTSPDPELTEEFINTELYARVSVAVMFNKLADLADMVGSKDEAESSHASLQSGKLFLLELFHSVVNDTDLAKELYKKYSATHRRKVRAWQMICILSRFVDQEIVSEVMCHLHTALYRNNMPAVRQYLETFAIYVYLKFPSLVGEQLVPMVRKYDMRTQALSSYVFIAANVILHATKNVQSRHLDELLPPIVPLLTSHHHSLRGFTQLLVYQVLSKLLPALNSGSYGTVSLEKRCFMELKSFLEDNSDCARLRVSMEVHLDAFDPYISVTPAGIFSNRVDDIEFECAHVSLLEHVIDFLNDVRKDLRCSMAKDATQLKNEQIHMQDSESIDQSKEETTMKMQKDMSLDFQKKVIVSKHEMQDSHSSSLNSKDTYNSLLDVEKEDELLDQTLRARSIAMEKLKAGRQQIILVASLIDRVPNLAGLARTCEVFKAASLVVDNANILQDKQFQLISVTAEKWVPIIEVPVSNVKGFLEKKKHEGYSIMGLEQTANSVALDQYVFPRKTVLVLGREKEGIPVELIHMLDACIEIPQLGVVRSLNVHVSGAIALWEYTRQQRSS
ncbi:uncharacterized protein LOC112522227 isoform X1 [Cynara cardunculus var. scolymus]|uniref:uncharacterized protein LOC112522227 isoform X1 n=1 Tax=Cynara cardunculus var. scolymus TaxID=59895 RepID=UPI000D62AD4E|nr:uncharacterized protein LOC112522227 isoform X1 [Cynara cardunculus var. scolymus]